MDERNDYSSLVEPDKPKRSDIQGIEKLTWVTKEQLNRLKATAIIYRFNSNIGFKVVSVTSDQIIIRAYQGYVPVGNYCTRKELVRMGKENDIKPPSPSPHHPNI